MIDREILERAANAVSRFSKAGLLGKQTFKDHVDPAQLGASYYLAVLNVPAMIVVHVLIFAYLLRQRETSRTTRTRERRGR